MKNKRIRSMLFVVLVTLFLVILSSLALAQQKINLNMGSTTSTSAIYAWCVATANAINKANVGINVTVIESGAALDNLRKLKAGAFDFALSIDIPSAMQMYHGIDAFKGQPWKDVRALFIRNVTADRLYVRKDSGLKTFAELSGKRFSPGIPGSSSAANIVKFNDILQTKIDLMPAALGDAIDALKTGRIVGLQKTSPLNAIDSSLIEVNLTTPITAIGYSKEDAERVVKVVPYIPFIQTSKGTISQLPDAGPMYETAPIVGAMTHMNLPEDVGYRIVKAYVEGLAEVAAAYPAIKGWDPIADLFKYVPEGGEVPAHAGVVRYAKEKGIQVPKRFIPPEYKGN